jgi:hypothetical protein
MRFPCSEGSLVELPSESVTSLNVVLSEAALPLLDLLPMVAVVSFQQNLRECNCVLSFYSYRPILYKMPGGVPELPGYFT